METVPTEAMHKPILTYPGPPPSPLHRVPPADGPHGVPAAHAVSYEPVWQSQYPSSFESHSRPDERRGSGPSVHPPSGPHTYPVAVSSNRDLPQMGQEVGPYGRSNSMPIPTHTPPDGHPQPPPPPHHYRPTNGSPHEPGPSQSAPPDHRMRISYPNGQHSAGEAPPGPYPVPPPPAQYGGPMPSHAPHPPPAYDTSYYATQGYGMRQRKVTRAQQACDQCRARKAKCDEGRPQCSHCKENTLTCVYKEAPPNKQDKSTQVVLDALQHLEDKLEDKLGMALAILSSIDTYGVARNRADANGFKPPPARPQPPPQPTISRDVKPLPAVIETMPQKPLVEVFYKAPNMPYPVFKGGVTEAPGSGSSAQSGDSSKSQQTDNDAFDGELAIPLEHTTAAHKLLLWPAIKHLLGNKYDDDYVMRMEEDRGLFRLYGRGEDDDCCEDPQSYMGSASGSASSPGQESNSVASHKSPNGVSASAPPPSRPRGLHTGVDEFGVLTADPQTIWRWHKSYMDHMHKLHPFLAEKEVHAKIEEFIKIYCSQKPSPAPPRASHGGDLPRGAKRKRSAEAPPSAGAGAGVGAEYHAPWERPRPRRIEKSVYNAITLLVLALGSICEWREHPLPGPVSKVPVDFRNEYIPGPSTPLPGLSPAGSESSHHQHPPQDKFFLPRNSHSHGYHSAPSPPIANNINGTKIGPPRPPPDQNPSYLRNMDLIPGLALYAYATEILGNLSGANGLPHVQAALLAALYAGQLAHPFQSHAWIYQAARACQVLVRPKRYEKLKDGVYKDLVGFSYWTCLQLESDILAELDLPASGISRSEARIELPRGRFTLTLPDKMTAPTTQMMFYYSAQVHLRKVLNRVHTDLYKAPKQGEKQWSTSVQGVLSMNLEIWRNSLPVEMRWKDQDPPANEINAARMRAKYYGARYIIHRPLLYQALHLVRKPPPTDDDGNPLPDPAAGDSSAATTNVVPGGGGGPDPVSPALARQRQQQHTDIGGGRWNAPGPGEPTVTMRDLPTNMRRACTVCIESAIASTKALDGIEGRPVVTNIFGTAHAQFGNMLVLSATYMSSLYELVDRDVLEKLLKRTIKFLLRNQNISPTLRADAQILTVIYQKIFEEPYVGSFSSTTSS